MKQSYRTCGVLFVLSLALAGILWAALPGPCQQSTAALDSMEWVTLSVERPPRTSPVELDVRAARDAAQRAAGMQQLCAETVRENPMLFLFPQPQRPSFHMQNVHVPLDILFIREDGEIAEIHRMEPGPALISPDVRVQYALELAAGQAEALGLAVGQRVRFVD